MRIQVETLGSVTVTVDGKPAASLLTKPLRSAAFLYIIIEPNPTREGLIGLFWPDRGPEKARRACNQTVYQLRLDLGEEWLVTHGNRLEVRAEVETDVAAFGRALKEGRVEDALALYRGPFLNDLGGLGGIEFEHWTEGIRARLERDHRKARRAAISAAVERGDANAALAHTRRWLEIDPLDDEANHKRIELLAATGAREDALRCWTLYSERVRRELGLEPLEDTVRLVEAIRAGTVGTAAPWPLDLPRRAPAPVPGPAAAAPLAGAERAATSVPRTTGERASRRLAGLFAVLVALMLAFYQPWSRPQSAVVAALTELDPSIIAILPFENTSADRELEIVANGLRESLALQLHANDLLAVVSNPAVRVVAERGMALDTIARRFNAGSVFTGSIRRVNGQVRLDLGLTDSREMHPYEPARVERPDSLVHLLEADMLEAVARILRDRLGHRIELSRTLPLGLSSRTYTMHLEARQYFEDARSAHRAGAPVSGSLRKLDRADSLLATVSRQAPEWTAPVLLRGWAARENARIGGTRDTARYRAHMVRAVAFADEVLAMDARNAEALELRGAARMYMAVVFGEPTLLPAAEADLTAATEYDDSRGSTWRHLSFLALQQGDIARADQMAARAINEDRFEEESAMLMYRMAATMRSAGKAEEADTWCRNGLLAHPDDYRFSDCPLANAAVFDIPRISVDSAEHLVRRGNRNDPAPAGGDPSYRPYYRQVLFATVLLEEGMRERAEEVVRAAVEGADQDGVERALDYDLAYYEYKAGHTERAILRLSRYMRQNQIFLDYARNDTRWDAGFLAKALNR